MQHYPALIGMQIIHFKKCCVSMSIGTSKVDKLLNLPSDSISDHVIFKISWRSMPPDPLVLACFAYLCALQTMKVHIIPANPTSTIMIDLAVPPTLFISLDPPLGIG